MFALSFCKKKKKVEKRKIDNKKFENNDCKLIL